MARNRANQGLPSSLNTSGAKGVNLMDNLSDAPPIKLLGVVTNWTRREEHTVKVSGRLAGGPLTRVT